MSPTTCADGADTPGSADSGRIPAGGRLSAAAFVAAVPALGAAWSVAGLQDLGRVVPRMSPGLADWLLAELRSRNVVALVAIAIAVAVSLAQAATATSGSRRGGWASLVAPIVGAAGILPAWLVEGRLLQIAAAGADVHGEGDPVRWMIFGGAAASTLVAVVVTATHLVAARRRGAATARGPGARAQVVAGIFGALLLGAVGAALLLRPAPPLAAAASPQHGAASR